MLVSRDAGHEISYPIQLLATVKEIVKEKENLKGYFKMFKRRLSKGLKEIIYSYSVSYFKYFIDLINYFIITKKEYFGLRKNTLYNNVLVVI